MNLILKLLVLLWAACATRLPAVAQATTHRQPMNLVDPVFQPGLATVKLATGFAEGAPDRRQTDWRSDLQLLIGVKAVDGARQTVYFVALTTLIPPSTNALGQPWTPPQRTNVFDWSGTNTAASARKQSYISSLYPVRVRVFNESGRLLKEGPATMPWGLVTNGLVDMCRLSLDKFAKEKDAAPGSTNTMNGLNPEDDELMRSFGGGFIWMMTMFGELQTVPAANDVWEKAGCAFRLPSVGTMLAAAFTGLSLTLEPQLQAVSLADPGPADAAARWYRLPIDLNSGRRNLTRVDIIVGPASGAELLLGGIRSIRAAHPTRQQHEFFAQVIGSGVAREDSRPKPSTNGKEER